MAEPALVDGTGGQASEKSDNAAGVATGTCLAGKEVCWIRSCQLGVKHDLGTGSAGLRQPGATNREQNSTPAGHAQD